MEGCISNAKEHYDPLPVLSYKCSEVTILGAAFLASGRGWFNGKAVQY